MQLFVFLGQLTIVGGQCMQTLSSINKCRMPNPKSNGYINNTELVECKDYCLANYRGDCYYMHWMPATKECFLFRATPQSGRDVDCVGSMKQQCHRIPGENCFNEDRGPTQTNELFSLISSESLCKKLCRFHPYCLSYLWNTLHHKCRLQTKLTPSTVRRSGDVWMRKKDKCPGERCALLRTGVAGSAKKDNTSKSMYSCVKKALDASEIYGLQWNYHDHTCWLQFVKHGYAFSVYAPGRRLLDIIQTKECNERPPPDETCFQREENMKMKGGFRLEIDTEEQCVDICKQLGNCGAVSWATMLTRKKCILHQLVKPLIRSDGYITYRPCQHTVPDHHLVTSLFTRRVKSSPRKLSTQHAIHVLECAFKCVRSSCNSFTLMDRDGPICTMSEKVSHQYVRKKLQQAWNNKVLRLLP